MQVTLLAAVSDCFSFSFNSAATLESLYFTRNSWMFHSCAFRPYFVVHLLIWRKPIVKPILKLLVSFFHLRWALFLPTYLRLYLLFMVSQDYTTTTYSISTPPVPKTSSISSKKSKHEPYSAHRALELFKTYADEDAPDVIGLEGFERLCNDTEMPMEGTRPLIFSWQIQAKEMGKISKNEWMQGMATLKSVIVVCNCDSCRSTYFLLTQDRLYFLIVACDGRTWRLALQWQEIKGNRERIR